MEDRGWGGDEGGGCSPGWAEIGDRSVVCALTFLRRVRRFYDVFVSLHPLPPFLQLMEDDLSVVFHEPVDVNAYPSYAEKVDEPMDFGTIKSKLDRWEYRRNDPLGFQRDVRLVSTGVRVTGDGGKVML